MIRHFVLVVPKVRREEGDSSDLSKRRCEFQLEFTPLETPEPVPLAKSALKFIILGAITLVDAHVAMDLERMVTSDHKKRGAEEEKNKKKQKKGKKGFLLDQGFFQTLVCKPC